MAEARDFQAAQYAFAAHIRDPEHRPAPSDVEERRMAIYRELFFNNISGFLADTLPVLHSLLPESHWQAMMRDFLVRHRCHSPYFLDIPREFLTYLEHDRGARAEDPPFLYELAHYEWAELALSVADEDTPAADPVPGPELLDAQLQVSPLAWPFNYRFPVHRIGPDYQPDAPPPAPTYLLLYRDPDEAVRFIELNAVSARLLALLLEHADEAGYSARQALETITAELDHPDPGVVIAGGRGILADWQHRQILFHPGESAD
ncbi:HvfC family RiPP maturation protein [Thiohalobacter thiocyanaticus]|uniref:DUF2063 domain-containing protein n=1 Tax=Thiohalobacter thiocyanaticus TaxID=585455 RepID=A0A426QHP8_9GAMM|nr:putative DNA-binding domain-containing protein [Thiohalobacter thiocyanaticus]RRQ21281.1 DUF2063 domain-containing protein [Thiohalobacter thiocyanaticus]